MNRFTVVLLLLLTGCATPLPSPAPVPQPVPAPAPGPAPAAPEEAAPAEAPAVTPRPPPSEPGAPAKTLSLQQFAERNDTRLLDVFVGMSKQALEHVMAMPDGDKWTNPYKHQTLRTRDGRLYEVLFYLTREPSKGRPITENNLTPVIVSNNKVTAIGRYQLKKLRRNLAVR